MEHERFDTIVRTLGENVTRRGALGLLAGLAGVVSGAEAKKDRNKPRKVGKKTKGAAEVSAQVADCLSPGPSSDISGCPYQNEDFSGQDLSGSRMVATNFRDADLIGTNLSSSNAKNAIFREADLTCANLRSSTLGGADFRAADLTRANLRSSGGCATALFNAATTFCGTVMCDGSVRNDDCPGGTDICCVAGDCGPGGVCQDGVCCVTDLAAAVSAASDGDTIRLCAGRFRTVNLEITKDLIIVGAGSGDDPAGDTILDAEKDGRVLGVSNNIEVTLRAVRITGGVRSFGGGISNVGTLTLEDAVVSGNSASVSGGIDNTGTLTLESGSRVEDNSATKDGGGIGNYVGATTTLEAGSVVTGNTAGGNGGGVFESTGTVTVANTSIVTGNTPNNCRPEGAVRNCTD